MRNQNPILWIVIIIALVGLSLSLAVFYKWNKPLLPSLDMPTLKSTPTHGSSIATAPPASITKTSISNAAVTLTQETGLAILQTTQLSPTATSHPLCNGPATMSLLVIGSDQRGASYLYGLADSIYVIYIDFTIPKMMI